MALVFDMDGVIVDSNPMHRLAWERFNRRYGIETDETMHRRMYGRHNYDIVRDFFGPELSTEEVAARGAGKEQLYRELIAERVEEMLVPGVRAFLDRHAGAPMAVATNAEPANLEFILDRTGLRQYFRVAIDGSSVSRPKPDPEIYLEAARRLGVDPRNCIIFEDSHSGVEAARAAGARTVGVRTTHRDLPGVELAIDSFASPELESWLEARRPVV